MNQSEDDNSLDGRTSSGAAMNTCCIAVKSRMNMKCPSNSRAYKPEYECASTTRPLQIDHKYKAYEFPHKGDERAAKGKVGLKMPPKDRRPAFGNPEFLVSDCWNTDGEHPLKLVEFYKEEDDSGVPVKKKRLESDEDDKKSPPYTKEFHLLTEVQKARILTAVEDTIKKLAYEDHYQSSIQELEEKPSFPLPDQTSVERFFCKKFLLPWVVIKVVEMVLCHIIQLTFLSQDAYFQRKNEFLPVVVTYYLTLFIIVVSLVVHISCYSYSGIENPCYFMGVISSSILTLTTSLGILIMLTSMEYYRTFHQILVLVFIGVLLCSLFAELCLCYVEVRKVWNRVGQTDQYY